MSYKTIAIRPKNYALIDDCELIYRKAHKEFECIPISKDKIIYEICKFYLNRTEKQVEE
jgi:hypothetical protein